MAPHICPMTIYFKSHGSWVLLVFSPKTQKYQQSMFRCGNVTKCILCMVNCTDFILSHAGCNIGTSQKPMTIYFKKQGSKVLPVYSPKSINFLKCNDLLRQFNQKHSLSGTDFIFLNVRTYNGTTHMPRDHLF